MGIEREVKFRKLLYIEIVSHEFLSRGNRYLSPLLPSYFSFFTFLYRHSWLNNTVSSNWGVKFPLSFEWEIAKRAFPMSDTPMNSGYGIRFQREQQNSPSWGTRIRFFSLSLSLIRNLVKRNSSLKEVPRSFSFSFQKFRESVN